MNQNYPSLAHPHQLYIGGRWVEPATGSRFDIVSSASEEVVATVAEAKEAAA